MEASEEDLSGAVEQEEDSNMENPEEKKTLEDLFAIIIIILLFTGAIFLGCSLASHLFDKEEKETKERNECLELVKDSPLKELSIRCIILISDN